MITAGASTLSSAWQYFALNLEPNAALFSAAFTQSILSLVLYATAYMTRLDLTRKCAEWKGDTTEQDSARFSTEKDFKIYYTVSLRRSMLYVAEMNTHAWQNCKRRRLYKRRQQYYQISHQLDITDYHTGQRF